MMMVMVTEAEYGGGSLKLALIITYIESYMKKNDTHVVGQAYSSFYINRIEISNQCVDRYVRVLF